MDEGPAGPGEIKDLGSVWRVCGGVHAARRRIDESAGAPTFWRRPELEQSWRKTPRARGARDVETGVVDARPRFQATDEVRTMPETVFRWQTSKERTVEGRMRVCAAGRDRTSMWPELQASTC